MAATKAKASTAAKTSESEPVKPLAAAPATQGGAPAPKRAPGAKEIPPFEWKLLGESSGAILTLFKAVEREDVEAQFERLTRDTYYKNLRIVEAKHVIKQPVGAKDAFLPPKSIKPKPPKPKKLKAKKKAVKLPAARKTAKKVTKKTKAARPAIKKAKKAPKPLARKKTSLKTPKKTVKKKVKKAAKKTPKKSTASKKLSKKRVAKKK